MKYTLNRNQTITLIQIVVSVLIMVLCIILLILGNKQHDKKVNEGVKLLYEYVENAYAEGQVDAMKGNIRISQINDSTYVWNASPWDSGKAPVKDTIIIK